MSKLFAWAIEKQLKEKLKNLIDTFLKDLDILKKGTKEKSFERYIINEKIEKWQKIHGEYTRN